MPNPRINVNEETWRQIRARAVGQNRTTSEVVTDALRSYLTDRKRSTTPDFTGAVKPEDLVSVGVEHPVHGVVSETDPILSFNPAPKPGGKVRKKTSW